MRLFVMLLFGFVFIVSRLLALASGFGWVLTRLLPFDLFQGTLLSLIAIAVVGSVIVATIRSLVWRPLHAVADEEDEESDRDELISSLDVIRTARDVVAPEVRGVKRETGQGRRGQRRPSRR